MLEPGNFSVMFHECMVFCFLDMPGALRGFIGQLQVSEKLIQMSLLNCGTWICLGPHTGPLYTAFSHYSPLHDVLLPALDLSGLGV